MPDAVNQLKEKMEDKHDKLLEKLDRGLDDLRGKLEKTNEALSEAKTKATENLGQANQRIASIEATIQTAKLVGVAVSVIIAILGGLGVWQILRTQFDLSVQRQELQTLITNGRQLLEEHGAVDQDALIEKLDSEINSESSIDGIRSRPDVQGRVTTYATRLKEVNAKLVPELRTDYFKIADALNFYLQENCDAVLTILEQFQQRDQNHSAMRRCEELVY